MKKLLDVIKHPLDSERFHQLVTRKQWFLFFNIAALLALIFIDRLHFSLVSILLTIVALAVVNAMAWLSSRNLPKLEVIWHLVQLGPGQVNGCKRQL